MLYTLSHWSYNEVTDLSYTAQNIYLDVLMSHYEIKNESFFIQVNRFLFEMSTRTLDVDAERIHCSKMLIGIHPNGPANVFSS